jgi:hypothetical protein
MIHFRWAIAALFIGGTIGFFLAGLCCAAAQNEKDRENNERRIEE